ncbi:FkbM family methyltransferase [Aeromicrobium sp. Root495]|uniref:FkbM family methyltransferase n=1 Tax=Aeromicrobium sp. Root495 TaxID=1736550 RepID=UPI0009E6EA03|nr:FkbM family methyltransferase [Aeromicrobium sp. Root495]RYJ07078.1 MAG: hypothetical protein EON52_03090 [Actinomycetales bacterium]
MSRARVFLAKAKMKLAIFFLEAWLRPERPAGMQRFGTYYGGWWIPSVDPDAGPAFCVGAGTDVTFDLELLRLGYRVYTADPTPAAVEHVEGLGSDLTFIPVGVWTSVTELEFAQDDVWEESWMIGETTPSGTSTSTVEKMPVTTVRRLVEDAGETEAAVLKLDIEGAEHRVIEQMLGDGMRPLCLCVEFDDHRVRAVIATTKLLRRAGYRLLQIEGLNHVYVREPAAG